MSAYKMKELAAFQRELLLYLPTVVRDVEELKQIMTAEQPEILSLWENIDRVMCEQFIESMDVVGLYGIKRWENILRITPNAYDSVPTRKARILAMLRTRLPYTIRWLRGWLNENIGSESYALGIDDYTIKIQLHYDKIEKRRVAVLDVFDLLGWVRPANMVLEVEGQREITGKIPVTGYNEQEIELEIDTVKTPIRGALLISSYVEMQRVPVV